MPTKPTHAVFEHEDIEQLPRFARNDLATTAHLTRKIRTAANKEPIPEYIVIDLNDEQKMVQEIIKVMKKYGKWE